MPEKLYSLAYFSRNTMVGTRQQLRAGIEQILASSRRNNASYGVTGALLFGDGCFAQVLEGRREDVETLFEAILHDPRHRDVTVMDMHPVEQRSFGQWAMAFGGVDGLSYDPGIRCAGTGSPDEVLATPAGRQLLAALREVVRRDDLARHEDLVAT
jgi:hypothetical protein